MMDAWPSIPFSISFSGGKTSAMMLIMLITKLGPIPERGVVSFQNTGKEHEETLKFVKKVQEYLDIDVVWLEYFQEEKGKPRYREVTYETANRTGQPILDAIHFENGFLPGPGKRHCTKKTKFDTLYRYLRDKGWNDWVNIVGIRSDEIAKRGQNFLIGRVIRRFPMAEWDIDADQVKYFWDAMPFRLELPIIKERNFLGNCQGCFLKSEFDLALLAAHDPEEFQWWESIEEKYGKQFTQRFWYKDLRAQVESGQDKFKVNGYFCQATLGECTGDDGDYS